MRILITENAPGDAVEVAQRLGAAGHQLAYCHRPDEPTGGDGVHCAGLTGPGRCPLADGGVDVAVDARSAPAPVSAREFGAVCALRDHTPLVISGPVTADAAGLAQGADVRCAPPDVVAACEQALAPTGPSSHRAVTEAARRLLRQNRHDARLTVTLSRRDAVVAVVVTTDRPLPPRLHEKIRAVARAALAPYTGSWPYAQVVFVTRAR